eukprot:1154279-Pelagomonas_calceolata.AAC.8
MQEDYRILCDNKCANWDEYLTDGTCITGESASKAVVATQAFKESLLGKAARASLSNFKAAGVVSSGVPTRQALCCTQLPLHTWSLKYACARASTHIHAFNRLCASTLLRALVSTF